MTATGDYGGVGDHRLLDDDTSEAILGGRSDTSQEFAALGAVVAGLRAAAAEPAPPPSPALAAVLAGGPVPAGADTWLGSETRADLRLVVSRPGSRRRLGRPARRLAAAALITKVAFATGAAAASVTGAAAAGILPNPVQDAIATAVGAVTPFEFPRHDEHGDDRGPQGATTTPGTAGEAPTQAPGAPGVDRPGGGQTPPTTVAGSATTDGLGSPSSSGDRPSPTSIPSDEVPAPDGGPARPAPSGPAAEPAPSGPQTGSPVVAPGDGTAPEPAPTPPATGSTPSTTTPTTAAGPVPEQPEPSTSVPPPGSDLPAPVKPSR